MRLNTHHHVHIHVHDDVTNNSKLLYIMYHNLNDRERESSMFIVALTSSAALTV